VGHLVWKNHGQDGHEMKKVGPVQYGVYKLEDFEYDGAL